MNRGPGNERIGVRKRSRERYNTETESTKWEIQYRPIFMMVWKIHRGGFTSGSRSVL